MQIQGNIRQARLSKGYSQQKMADLLGEKRSTYAEWEKNTEPKATVLTKISEITGWTVQRLLGTDDPTIHESEVNPYLITRREKKNGHNRNISDNTNEEGVPVFDVPIDASFLERYRDEGSYQPRFFINVPKLRNCDFGAVVSGSSMYPIMKSGTIAICRVVERFDFFEAGEMYYLSTVNGFETVKYVQHTDNPDELLLIPHNEKIRPYPIKKEMVLKMCIVEAWLNFR